MAGYHCTAGIVAMALLAGAAAHAQEPPPAPKPAVTVRITSPLGRTGLSTTIRLVAQVHGRAPGSSPVRVYFTVDGRAVGDTAEGPSFSVPWLDENPFEGREIAAEARTGTEVLGRTAITLPPFEIDDRAEVTSVLLEAGVYDAAGHAVAGLPPSAFTVRENDVPQKVDQVTAETTPATVVLLVDNSQSLARHMDAVRAAASRLGGMLHSGDRVIVSP